MDVSNNNSIQMKVIDKSLEILDLSNISQNIKKKFNNEIEIILCGGGRKNFTLVNHLKNLMKK